MLCDVGSECLCVWGDDLCVVCVWFDLGLLVCVGVLFGFFDLVWFDCYVFVVVLYLDLWVDLLCVYEFGVEFVLCVLGVVCVFDWLFF